MNAKLSDPKRIMGHLGSRRRGRPQNPDEPEKEDDEDEGMLDYRILVHESQAGSVIGRGGERIKELRDVSILFLNLISYRNTKCG